MAVPSGGGPLVFVADLDDPHLSDDDHHHLARVRRVRHGAPVVVGDGRGSWRAARFVGDRPEIVGDREGSARPAPSVGVGFALVKGAKPELVVQKLTELGVDEIQPFTAARSVVRWDPSKADAAHGRLVKVAREAAMQSRQPWLPSVGSVVSFASIAAQPGVALADREGAPPGLDRPFVLIGPEGGWDDAERDADLPLVRLSTGVLRAETAAIVAGALLVALRSATVAPADDA